MLSPRPCWLCSNCFFIVARTALVFLLLQVPQRLAALAAKAAQHDPSTISCSQHVALLHDLMRSLPPAVVVERRSSSSSDGNKRRDASICQQMAESGLLQQLPALLTAAASEVEALAQPATARVQSTASTPPLSAAIADVVSALPAMAPEHDLLVLEHAETLLAVLILMWTYWDRQDAVPHVLACSLPLLRLCLTSVSSFNSWVSQLPITAASSEPAQLHSALVRRVVSPIHPGAGSFCI